MVDVVMVVGILVVGVVLVGTLVYFLEKNRPPPPKGYKGPSTHGGHGR